MNISNTYDIQSIVIDLEVALQIDATDYAERQYSKIIENIKNRIIRQYNVDLRDCKITDNDIEMSKSRQSAQYWVENMASLHALLSGYHHIVRDTHEITIRPINVNWLGFDEDKLMKVFKCLQYKKTRPSVASQLEIIKTAIGTISACMEKKLLLIMVVCFDLGFEEITSCIAEILYLGGKV